jgi:hypothetical protein
LLHGVGRFVDYVSGQRIGPNLKDQDVKEEDSFKSPPLAVSLVWLAVNTTMVSGASFWL